jgi:hypothetical protein
MDILSIVGVLLEHPKAVFYWFLATAFFWFIYATLMRLRDKRENYARGTVKWWAITIVGYLLLIVGYPYDVLYNLSYGSLMLWQLPRRDVTGTFEWTFTARLQRTVYRNDWRGFVARFICRYMVEPWDADHCGEGYVK